MSEIIFAHQNDELMREATIQAINHFKYYWRELSWEYKRIIPSFDSNAVKVPLKTNSKDKNAPPYEHMWFSNIDFDGENISGELINEPSWVSTIKVGDSHKFKLNEISDWMYVIEGRVFGGFTINQIRKNMNKSEMRKHDKAWGLDFGDPSKICIAPGGRTTSKFFGLIKREEGYQIGDEIPEHPMSINMAEKCEEALCSNKEMFLEPNENGVTMLHLDALAGNLTQVKLLIKYGASKTIRNKFGKSPKDLALILGWERIASIL